MSLDLMLIHSECKSCGHKEETDWYNYTSNVSYMWREVYPEENMVQIEGLTGKESEPKLLKAINSLSQIVLKNPTNGWGSQEGFLEFLFKLYKESVRNPNSIWEASR